MRRHRFIATSLVFLGLAGCGDGLKRVPVRGKITADGRPLDHAVVQFIPTGSTRGEGGIGVSDDDGNFSLTGSRAGARGVVPGEYKVRVSRLIGRDGSALPPEAKQAEHPGARESVPPPYTSLEGTPLTVTVPEAGGPVAVAIPAKVLGRK
jgi:hypothetical protein